MIHDRFGTPLAANFKARWFTQIKKILLMNSTFFPGIQASVDASSVFAQVFHSSGETPTTSSHQQLVRPTI
jgi:hypothetical protein